MTQFLGTAHIPANVPFDDGWRIRDAHQIIEGVATCEVHPLARASGGVLALAGGVDGDGPERCARLRSRNTTDEEWVIMRQHPVDGAERVLKQVESGAGPDFDLEAATVLIGMMKQWEAREAVLT